MNAWTAQQNMNGQGRALRRCVSYLIACLALVCRADAELQAIVADNFDTMTTEQSLTGRTPDTCLPGSNWVTAVNSGYALTEELVNGNQAVNGYAHGSAILLASSGSYFKPTRLTIRADLRLNTVSGLANGADMRGLGLGFYKGVNVHPDPKIFAQGLMLDSTGNLNLQTDYTFLTPVAYAGGTFDPSQYYTLTYTVDLASGHILDIDLEGSTADYSSFYSTTLFNNANTKYAGLYASSATVGSGEFDSFSITTVMDEPEGDVIVSDSFNLTTAGVTLTGRAPDVSLPGSTWVDATTGSELLGEDTVGGNNCAKGVTHAASAISLASAGSYTKPKRLTISAEIRVGTTTGSALDSRGVFIGFYQSGIPAAGDARILSHGLILDAAGNLTRTKDTVAATPVAYAGGAFDPTTYYKLSFEVDTTTGDILNIELEGSTADYSSLYDTANWFNDADTMYAGLYVASSAGGTGQFDNFRVTTPPPKKGTILLIK